MADKKVKVPVDPDIGKPDMSPQPNALDAAAQDAMLRPIQATPSPAPPANMQDQGPSMEDLTRAQEMARQQLVKLPLRLAASRLSAIATHHDPNEVKEQDVANELTRESGLPEVLQRQSFEGARAKQILERAQGQHQMALASQEEENARPTSAPNLATADMLNGMASAAGKMFGEEPPVYINRNTFTNANHLQSYSAFLDHWLSTKQAQAKEARLGPEADARLQEMKDKLEELTRHNKTTERIGQENADTRKNAPPKGGAGGTALKPPSTKGTEQLKNQEALSTELDTMPKSGDALELRRWAKRVNDMAAVAVGAGRMQKLLMQNIGVNIPGGSDNMIKFLGEAAASPQYRAKLQGELKRMVANEREATIDAEERGFHDMSKWREKYPKQQPGGLPPIRTIGGQTFKLNPDGKTYDPVGAQPNG